MNLANKLTLTRIALTVLFIALFLSGKEYSNTAALLVFIAAALTDYYDGKIARERGQRTVFGDLFDPLADKILVLSAFLCFLTVRFDPPLGATIVPVWAVIVIVSREIAVTGLRVLAAGRGRSIAAGTSGKQKTVSQLVAVIVILVGETLDHDYGRWLFANLERQARFLDLLPIIYLSVVIIAVTFTVTSGVEYFWKHRDLLDETK